MKKIMAVLFCLLAVTPNAVALDEKIVDGKIVHDSYNRILTDNFVEDVISLLPPEMIQSLEPHRGTIIKEARFTVMNNYWRYKVIGMNDFRQRLQSISIDDSSELASQLGMTVKNIFEVALRPNSDDIMNEGLEKNLKDAFKRWKGEQYEINYEGYRGQSVDTLLVSLYDMKKRGKTNIYPNLVIIAADLWSAIWQRGGGKTQLVKKTFVRKPADFQFRKR